MFTADVRFEGWTTEDWVRFLHLWKPRAPADREATRPRGGVLVIHSGGRLKKMVHTARGRLVLTGRWPMPLAEVAREHHASWALSAHTGALEDIMERLGARCRRGDDAIAQSLLIVQIVREMTAEGALEMWPQRLRGVPPPTEAMVRRALDALCDDGRALCLGLFKDGGLWTAFVARRRGHGFDVVAGPDELRPAMGFLSGDWRRDYRHLVRAVEDRYAPLSFGCFGEVDVIRELQIDPRSGAWSRAVAVRDVAISPMPMAVGVALGVDSARYAFDSMKVVTTRVDPFGFLDPLLRAVRLRLGAASGGRDLTVVLGFDPLAALRSLLSR